jgi:hypothetical protein
VPYRIYSTNSDCTLINSLSCEMKIFLPMGDRCRLKHVAVKTVFVFIINGSVDCFIVDT